MLVFPFKILLNSVNISTTNSKRKELSFFFYCFKEILPFKSIVMMSVTILWKFNVLES